MSRALSSANTVSHRFANQASDVAAPASGFGIFYVKSNKAYFRPTGGSPIRMDIDPKDQTDWGTAPDNSLSFAGQDSSGAYYEINGSEMRQWVNYAVSGDISTEMQSMTQFIFTDGTARTVTVSAIVDGDYLRAYAMTGGSGSGHKILLPANHYWTNTSTNRAALFDTATDYIDAVCYDVGGGVKRLLVYGMSGVTYSAS